MALHAYFDESGAHNDARVFVLAGVVGNRNEWDSFEREWNSLLQTARVRYAHMKEMENFKGDFKGWTNADKIAFMQSAINIFNTRRLGSIVCSIDMKNYRELISAQVERLVGNKYTIAFGFCMHLIAEWTRQYERENEVDFVFEVNDFKGHIDEMNAMLCSKYSAVKAYLRVGDIAFKGKHECVPLQAADLIAYEAYKGYDNLLAGRPRLPRKSLIALSQGTEIWGYHVDASVLQLYVDRANNILAGRPVPDVYSMLGIEDEQP